jgi:hypothetical protein
MRSRDSCRKGTLKEGQKGTQNRIERKAKKKKERKKNRAFGVGMTVRCQ